MHNIKSQPTHRRLFLKPPGANPNKIAQLKTQLANAIDIQKALACQSVNILPPLTDLEETRRTFTIEYAPAHPINTTALFNPNTPPPDNNALFNATATAFDALRTAHAPPTGKPVVHGGICPGTLLLDDNDNLLITDFGWAQAICKTLGPTAYLNLAIGYDPDHNAVVWQILDNATADRDDRICGFIDPQKYGSRQITTFEPTSDIIAAAFVLHLVAEHQHPFFPNDPDAHRLAATAEFLGMRQYDNQRRDDLANATDERINTWSKTIANCLERTPRNRPTATDAHAALTSAAISTTEPSDRLNQTLQSLESKITTPDPNTPPHLNWPQADNIARHDNATPEITQRAQEVLQTSQTSYLLNKTQSCLNSDDWSRARTPIEASLQTQTLPPESRQQAEQFNKILQTSLETSAAIAQITSDIQKFNDADPVATVEFLDDIQSRVANLAAAETCAATSDQIRELHENLELTLESLAEFAEQLVAEKEADEKTTTNWLTSIEDAVQNEKWESAESLLADQPTIRHWPEGALEKRNALQKQCDEHRIEERAQAAITADHEAAQRWFEKLSNAATAENWVEAAIALDEKPTLTHWPAELQPQIETLEKTVTVEKQRLEEHELARQWCSQVLAAVENEDWSHAVEVYAQRPVLEHWPADVVEKEDGFKAVIAENQETLELEQRITAEHHRQANEWLARAEEEFRNQKWQKLRDTLNQPPKIDRWPDGVKDRATKLDSICQVELTEHVLRKLGERTRAVTLLAEGFVRDCAREKYATFIDPSTINATIDNELFTSTVSGADGHAHLTVTLQPADRDPVEVLSTELDFALDVDKPHVFDDGNRLRQSVQTSLHNTLLDLQQRRPIDIQENLRRGLFPDTDLQFDTPKLREHVEADMILVSSTNAPVSSTDTPVSSIDTRVSSTHTPVSLNVALVWHPGELRWVFADRTRALRRICDVVADAVIGPLRSRLLDAVPALRPYDDILNVDAAPPTTLNEWKLDQPLTLAARLSLRPDGKNESVDLFAFPLQCKQLGRIELDIELIDAESALERILVEAQKSSQTQMIGELRTRLTRDGIKPTVTSTPAKISKPTDNLSYRIELKHRRPITLSASWQATSFTYQLADGWRDDVDRLAGAPNAGERFRAVLVPLIVGFVSIATLGGGGYYYYINRPITEQKTVNGGPGPVNVDPQRSLAGAFDGRLEQLRDTIRSFGVLANEVDRLVPDQNIPQADNPVIRFDMVGLQDATGQIRLDHDPSTDTWSLSENAKNLVRTKAANLERLMTTAVADRTGEFAREAVSQNAVSGNLVDFIDPFNVRTSTQSADWSIESDGITWSADVQTTIAVGQYQSNDSALSIPFVVRAGSVEFASTGNRNIIDANISNRVKSSLIELQQQAHRDWMSALDATTLPPEHTITPPADATSLRARVSANIATKPLQPRTYNADWNPSTLQYVGESTWDSAVTQIKRAISLLETLNSSLPNDHWLRHAIENRRVAELSPPTGSTLTLAATAPWVADASVDPRTLNERDRLELTVDLNILFTTDDASTIDISKLTKPDYWPLIDRYAELIAAPTKLVSLNASEIAGIAATDEAGLRITNILADLDEPNRYMTPTAGATGVVDFQLTPIPKLDLQSQLNWEPNATLASLPVDQTVITSATSNVSPPTTFTRSFTLGNDGTIVSSWSNLAEIENALNVVVPRLDALDKRLASMADRSKLESEFNALLNSNDTLDLSADPAQALTLLRQIWALKGDGRDMANVPDVSALSRKLRTQLLNRGMTVEPTIFGEYFTGNTTTFAICWSAKPTRSAPVEDGPMLLRLLDNGNPRTDGGGIAPESIEMGQALLGRILDTMPNAVVADGFDETLGLLLAPDDKILLIELAELQASAAEYTSFIQPLAASGGSMTRPKRWNRLAQLSPDDGFQWESHLVTSLATANNVWTPIPKSNPDDPRRWSISTIERATGSP